LAPPASAYDIYTAAVHELAHVLGFGTSAAFTNDVFNDAFIGAAVQQLYQGPAPLLSIPGQPSQHFDFGVASPPFLENPPSPSLGPTISKGQRKLFTPLDYAVMADLGWSVPRRLLTLPGDVDEDYDVDGHDFLVWQQGLGAGGGVRGDVSGDLVVDGYDAWIMEHYFGAAAEGVSASPIVGVPEPSGATLIAAAVLATTSSPTRRRRPAATAGRSR
jgi:hypothetical protein